MTYFNMLTEISEEILLGLNKVAQIKKPFSKEKGLKCSHYGLVTKLLIVNF